jgi:hypothetical protein
VEESEVTATLRTAAQTVASRRDDGLFSYQSWKDESERLLVEAGQPLDEATELFFVYDMELTNPEVAGEGPAQVISINGSSDADELSLRLAARA